MQRTAAYAGPVRGIGTSDVMGMFDLETAEFHKRVADR